MTIGKFPNGVTAAQKRTNREIAGLGIIQKGKDPQIPLPTASHVPLSMRYSQQRVCHTLKITALGMPYPYYFPSQPRQSDMA